MRYDKHDRKYCILDELAMISIVQVSKTQGRRLFVSIFAFTYIKHYVCELIISGFTSICRENLED